MADYTAVRMTAPSSSNNPSTLDRFRGCLLGLAVGDAVGTTVEFAPRDSFEPVTDMVGGGPFNLQPGQWTDDTSMALCLAESLLDCGGFDAHDQQQRYWRWLNEGHMSSTGECFDIGNTVRSALYRYQTSGEPFAGSQKPRSAGNGCIMRLAPVPMYFAGNHERAVYHSIESSRTTHGAPQCLDACRLFGSQLARALAGASKEELLIGNDHLEFEEPLVAAIAAANYVAKPKSDIRGSGYVVESLEAALWCFYHTGNYQDAVLLATNLGDDADTTAAITGQIAGAFYGASAIPEPWRVRLARADFIKSLADRLHEAALAGPNPHGGS